MTTPIVLLIALGLAPCQARAADLQAAPDKLNCQIHDCARVLPQARRFEASADKPWFAGLDDAGETIGYVALSTDIVDIKAYSGKPLVTLVGLSVGGVITGARVVHHSEPILLVGIPEAKLHAFVDFYAGKRVDLQVVFGRSSDADAVSVDVISGATVTALAQNQTILETARTLAEAVGVIKVNARAGGHFIAADKPWTWQQMVDSGLFGRLVVTEAEMGVPRPSGAFIDLTFAIIDPPHIGAALMGEHNYAWMTGRMKPGEHLVVVLGNGSSSFKGSGFVRGGIFDRVRVEQGLRSLVFRDHDYYNLSRVAVAGAPAFNEAAVFIARDGKLDPGAAFDLVFIGSRYDGEGGFSRDFHAFRATSQLPATVWHSDAPPAPRKTIVELAWDNAGDRVWVLGAFLGLVFLVFAGRRWSTLRLVRLQRLHLVSLLLSFGVLGVWLHAQPSVTQILTLVDAVVNEWRWGLFLSEPLLFIFWIFIAVVTLIWGRGVFCGWLCPYGAMTELLYKVGHGVLGLFGRKPFELPEGIHRYARYARYVVLAVLIPAYLISPEIGERMAEIEPFKSTFYVLPWTRDWAFFGWWLLLAGLSIVWYRPFCRYLCPLGAALALPSSLRRSGPYRRNACSTCKICTRGCEPRAIRPDGTIDSRECLSCMECEANYRDETVCPPLVGLERLQRRAAEGGKALDPEKLARLRYDRQDRR